ncbi:two-component sensor histidine kinase [Roseovarius sp. HI0049]|nr:two-component sensor histidine kinase [Roseovarius sp. HI0049]
MNADNISSLLGAIPLPAVLIGRGERILGANDRALALLGQGITGRHFITALRQPAILDAIEAALRDHQPRTTRYLSSDGTQDTTFNVTCSPVQTEAGHGVLVCFEDVTHLEQAGQMRRDFVANVSHELRSPLTALLGFIETLRGPAKGDTAVTDRFLGTMQDEAQRMERLVRDLLSLSRVEGQERVRPTDPVDLCRLIGTVRHALTPLAIDAGVRITAQLPETPIIVPGDSDQLQQVITNLTENAVKYGGQGKTVQVSLTTTEQEPLVRGPAAVISVRDEGPGIDPVHIPRLTERFYRIDSHRSRAMGGTGLGLAIVKHIVGRHRGRLRIESQPGEGSVFRVVLPRDSARQVR